MSCEHPVQPGAALGPTSLRFVHHTVPVPGALRDPRGFTLSQRSCEAKLLLNKASGGGLRLYLEFSTCLPAPFPCCSSQRCSLCEPFWRAVCPLLSGETGQQVPASTPKWQGLIWRNTQSLQSLLGALAQGLAHRSDPELGVCRGLGTWPQLWGGHARHPAEARAEPEASTDFRTGLRLAENGTDAVCPEATPSACSKQPLFIHSTSPPALLPALAEAAPGFPGAQPRGAPPTHTPWV